MKITDLLNKSGIELSNGIKSKEEAINKLVNLMDSTGNLKDKESYKKAVLERESLSTTGIGDGIAIPHAKTTAVKNAGLSAMVVKDGVDYDSLDGQPAKLFFMIAAPEEKGDVHLEVLARLSTILMDEKFRERLINVKDKNEFLKLIDDKENEKLNEENSKEQKSGYRVLAVTACPTGIAHTFMAAESLENKGKDMGVSIKVETNGSGGAKNVLTREEIENAECIIVAADKKVDMARFEGKRVIQTKVANGIHKAEALINEALSGNAPVYHHSGKGEEIQESNEKESIGRQIYKHLMNGVSHMLPFVIGGGILIALAFLFDDYSIDPANFGMNTPFAAFLKTVGGTAFGFMLPVLAGYIAMSIGDRPALAVGFVGGMLANEGGSGFLGALLAGFIAGYLVVGLKKLFSTLPDSLEGLKPVLLYPFFGILIIGALIVFVINPPVAALNNGITNTLNGMGESSKILLGAVLGGMMAIDMGGPINKAAYVFGTASLANGQFEFMAAVMIGGMVPPLAIALCTTFFKNRFTKRERQSGLTNYIMGLSFITEGAIPFAAADPLRVIPACVVGSAVAGALSMAFGCALRAPHGGIFVLPVITNPLGYFGALVIGSLVGMIVLGLLKKKVD
ncbi:PTS fructose transporter subunit IIABC [Clostridium frigidicarnis]|uniref:PTS system D-fructose-specific IIA component (F1P-forming), Frc family /PTS system D-fructose-specific IIB component (F1P-forming), Frc family /PTS system D-fructose-specific IIC component (F1P-for... n=1 Tax=Clostridium frigidicarnis TaxID=84698 RepID=A0A1I0W3M3_9CLOT|nr:fructose-specific PTS transporter subunit EIIC [Clostridium frigidicarnis]SFA83201.1 PTS system D-fructose-specific IIA component (F1P-forming), Frc family /PTS system D-fructose-specific IIB component (F1P-forming), Frc family /PTS system D-fructose-specific IIC component (F1P-forming), Frc family [Clostridium frigidicarnis]